MKDRSENTCLTTVLKAMKYRIATVLKATIFNSYSFGSYAVQMGVFLTSVSVVLYRSNHVSTRQPDGKATRTQTEA